MLQAIKPSLRKLSFGLQCALLAALLLGVMAFVLRGLTGLPTAEERQRLVHEQLLWLENDLRHGRAAARMQAIFPEGACFTCTLHGLAWANLTQARPADTALRRHALAAIAWTLEQYATPTVKAPFVDTQVRLGVFYLGQRNLLLGRYLELLEPNQRPAGLVDEFHTNAAALAAAFLASPTHHLDSYPDMCWPADNVTALASLLLHDRLYGTAYRQAYDAWKTWTLRHADPATGLPAGMLDSRNGQLKEPSRGCANSWNLALLHADDPTFITAQYQLYKRCFEIRRLGFHMFREYPASSAMKGNIDSGPIIWGAGTVASGVGLGTALVFGDDALAADIHALATMFGWPRAVRVNGARARNFLWGALPVGDAFLSWSLSQPGGALRVSTSPSLAVRLGHRLPLLLGALAAIGMLALRGYFLLRHFRRITRPATAAKDSLPTAPAPGSM